MSSLFSRLFAKVVETTVGTILALFVIGGATRVATYYEVKPAQDALAVVDGILVQERATVIAQGPTIVASGTEVISEAVSAQ